MRHGQLLIMHVLSGKLDLAVEFFLTLGWKERESVLPGVRIVADPKGFFALAISEGDCNLISYGINGFRDLKRILQTLPQWAKSHELPVDIVDWGQFLAVSLTDIFPYQLMLLT